MIFARDKSQMCNNLLQFAHVYAWGRKHHQRVISMRFSYKYPYFEIQKTRYANFFWYLFAKYAAALRLLHTVSFRHDDHREEKIHYMETHSHFVVSGWNARFYDEFLEYRDEICNLFRLREEYAALYEIVWKLLCLEQVRIPFASAFISAEETIRNFMMENFSMTMPPTPHM